MRASAANQNREETISPRQLCLLLILFVFGNAPIFILTPNDYQHCWISYMLAGVGGIVMLAVYLLIYHLHDRLSLTAILKNSFGNIIGSAIALLYAFFFLFHTAMLLCMYSGYLRLSNYFDTPQGFINLVLCIVITYALYKGIRVIARVSEFFIWPILVLIVLISIILIQYYDFNNIYPLKNIDPILLMNDSIYPMTLSYAMTVVFLVIFPAVGTAKTIKKPLFLGMGIASVLTIWIVFRTLIVLGGSLIGRYVYPIYFSYSITYPIKFGLFFSTFTGLTVLIKGLVQLYASQVILSNVFHVKKSNLFIIPMVLIAGIFGTYLFKTVIVGLEFCHKYWTYIALIFQFGLPFVVLLISLIKKRGQKAVAGNNS